MMTLATTFGVVLLLINPQRHAIPAATFLFQAQENTPTQNPSEQPPSVETKPAQPEQAEQPRQAAPETAKPKPAAPKKATAKASAAKKPIKKHSHPKGNPVVVVRNGGTADNQGQISSPESDQQTTERIKNTNSLLSATTTNLQKIAGKQLNPTEQDMVMQIRNYMRQSKLIATNGDVQGANNLAVKAHLLSEELVKP